MNFQGNQLALGGKLTALDPSYIGSTGLIFLPAEPHLAPLTGGLMEYVISEC